MKQTEAGLRPEGEGWFVVNARDGVWVHNDKFGKGVTFEGTPHFPHFGINVQVLWPGQPNGYYHGEAGQEDFLVLSGECLVLIEEQERRLGPWDFVHCPPWTNHIFVGTGDEPCVILCAGARQEGIVYPVSELALKHGAGVSEETPEPRVAYADTPETSVGPYREGLPESV
jgi:uncharacterized cupin superfamily protein